MRFFRKKSPWLLHFNTGACLPGEMELILGDGRIMKISELVEPYVKGRIADPHTSSNASESVLSWDGYSAIIRPLVRVHKLRAPNTLVKIETNSGIPVRLTPDHKVLVDTSSGPQWVEAKDLKVGDYLCSPRVVNVNDGGPPNVVDCVPSYYLAHVDQPMLVKLKHSLRRKFDSLKNAANALGIDKNRLCSRKKQLNIEELKKISNHLGLNWLEVKEKIVAVSGRNFAYEIQKRRFDEDLLRLLGLIASDGFISVHKRKGSVATYNVSFANKELTLVDDFLALCGKWFPQKKVAVGVDKRTGVRVATIYNPLLVWIAGYLGMMGNLGETDLKPIFRLPTPLIASFLGGYFDGDGHVAIWTEGKRERIQIGFTTGQWRIAKRIHQLLKRVGIGSRVRCFANVSSFGKRELYQILITDPVDITRFLNRIPIKHPNKLQRLKVARIVLARKKKRQSIMACAPLSCNNLLKEIRKNHGLKQSDVLKWPTFVSMIEKGKRIQKETVKKLVSSLRKLGCDGEKINDLVMCSSDEYYLDHIRKIEFVESDVEWVYNVTVEGTHSFIPEGAFVVKNCNGCDIELVAALTPRYDIERLGMLKRATPRHADILVVTGPITKQCLPRLIRIYEQMPEPKLVVAVGSCPATNGIFDGCYNVVGPLDKHLPVDAYVPGCPPRPEAIVGGLLKVGERWER